MKLQLTIFFIAMGMVSTLKAQQLGDLRWQYRVLIIMDPNNNPAARAQLKSFDMHTAEMQKRDLLLFQFNGRELLDQRGNPTPMGIRELPSPAYEGVILIGKDGGVKFRKPFPVAPSDVFKRIDEMPMRRSEVRDKGK